MKGRCASLIIAPADEKQLAEALASGAGAVIVDLALAPPGDRASARARAAKFLKEAGAAGGRPGLVVGVNPLDWARRTPTSMPS